MLNQAADTPAMLTVEEAALFLRISRNLAYELVRQGALPHLRLGRRLLVPRQTLERWVEEQSTRADVR